MLEYRRVEGDYSAEDLKHLSDLEHVRQRPSMYIGDTAKRGLHHLVYEVVDNSIDESMAGHAKNIHVTINIDGSVTVQDDGRGIPVEQHPDLGFSTLQGVMTVLKFGGKFDKGAYRTSGGLHGVGVTVVNFLSEWCEVEVSRGGYIWQQEYERGVPQGDVRRVGSTVRVGTKTTFKPDPAIFPISKYEYGMIQKRMQELAFLNRGVRINCRDERVSEGDSYLYPRGIIEFVEHFNRASEAVHNDILYFSTEVEDVGIEVAMQYSGEFTENVHSFVNNINTIEGGTHLSGFRAALTRAMTNYGKKEDIFKDLTPTGEDFREGLTAVLALRVAASAVRGPDEDQARQQRSRGDRHVGRRRLFEEISGGEPQERQGDAAKGCFGGRSARERSQGRTADSGPQGSACRARFAGQAPRLHQQRRREVRAVPRRGRFRRRQRRRGPAARVPGDSFLARQDHQRLQVP